MFQLSLKPFLLFFAAKARIRIAAAAVACIALHACAIPLENWRFPFYRLAAERGDYESSHSGMFWDDLGNPAVFDSLLWPDSASHAGNHFTFEPALTFRLSDDPFYTDKQYNFHGDFLCDFRFKKLLVRAALDADQSYKSDPRYPWHSERFAAGRFDEAYLQYTGAHGFARLGRINRVWGPFPDRSLVLSNNPFSYDAFEWQVQVPFLEFRHMFAAFSDLHSNLDTRGPRASRFFTAHALNFIAGKWVSLGIFETVVFGRVNSFPDFQYVNPVSIYTVINTNQEGIGNLMLGFHGRVHPFTEKVTLKGQIVFDDFQVDNETAGDQEPMHWACDIGAYVKDCVPVALRHHAALEYRYLSRWMYTVNQSNTLAGERYSFMGKSLGYDEIDGDEFTGSFSLIGKNFWAATIGGGVARKGTNTIDTFWPADTALHGALGYTEEVPLSERPDTEKAFSFFLTGHGYFRDYAALHAGIENRWIKNRDHIISGSYEYDPKFNLTITCHFSNLFIRF